MKQLLFIIAFLLMGSSTFAQEQVTSPQNEYKEVMVDNLPGEVTKAIGKNYPKANIDKAYWSDENMKYKIEVIKDDNTSETLYLDREGIFEFE